MHCIHWGIIWTAITAIATVGLLIATIYLVFFGKKQLNAINQTNKEEFLTNKEEFLHQLKLDFFTDNARILLTLLETRTLEFKTSKLDDKIEIAYFERLNKDTSENILEKLIKKDKMFFSSYEMDDFLLLHLEDLGLLFKKKIVTIEDVDQLFGYYIATLFEDCEVKKYLDWTATLDSDIYSNFKDLYHELKLYQSKPSN